MSNKSLTYYHNLDGLRGVAALAVILFHFFHNTAVTQDLMFRSVVVQITEFGQHGVTLFFVLSGFVITRILLNTKEDNTYFYRFYKNRALRIFPLYYLYLLLHYNFFPCLFTEIDFVELKRQFPYFFYIQGFTWLTGWPARGPGHYWSLAVEEHFYLVWPLLVYFLNRRNIKYIALTLIALNIPIKLLLLDNGLDINYQSISRYDSIMMGCVIAIMERDSNFSLKALSKVNLLLIALSVITIGGIIYINQESLPLLKSSVKHIILSFFFAIVIYQTAAMRVEKSLWNSFLESRIMQYLGKISYGLYVWHIMVLMIVASIGLHYTLINLALTLLFSVMIAHLSYHGYEKLFLKLKYIRFRERYKKFVS